MSNVRTDGVLEYLSGLNEAQQKAVVYGAGAAEVAGPLLVIAGAGSGKTNTLAHRVAHLLAMGAEPDRILLLTFSPFKGWSPPKHSGRFTSIPVGELCRVSLSRSTVPYATENSTHRT